MDPQLLLVLAAMFMLLTGGVLGLVHGSLTHDVQPAARDWRIGTLLVAGGALVSAYQETLPLGFSLGVANFCFLAGATLYWFSIRRFCSLPVKLWMWLPAMVGVLGVIWFAELHPNHRMRVLFASPCWLYYCASAAWNLYAHAKPYARDSRRILTGLFVTVCVVITARILYFSLAAEVPVTMMRTNWAINYLSVMLISALPVVGTTTFILMCFERIRGQLEHVAATDYLTELPNRRTITQFAEAKFAQARRSHPQGGGFAVVIIDIDHFKSVNDRYGHEMGDRALTHVADLLRQHSRAANLVGRQGGEEFVALLDVDAAEDVSAAVERLRAGIEGHPLRHAGHTLSLTASFGVAVLRADDATLDALTQRADAALYQAKASGRNRAVLG